MIIIFRRTFLNSHQFFISRPFFFLLLIRFWVEMDNSYHFHKIRLEREIFSPNFHVKNALFHAWVKKI